MYKIYQVEFGDTLQGVAQKLGTSVDEIMRINGFMNDGDLVVGSLIIVPNNETSVFEMYRVNAGDTVYSIARMYNVDPDTLLLLNGLNKDDYIYPNQQLTVPRENVVLYITKEGDTLDFITNNLGIDANTLLKENEKIFVLPEQLIVHMADRTS